MQLERGILYTVLRGVLFARGRRIAGDGIASDWARGLLLCVFKCHAGPDKRWGLEEWCCFVSDCKFPSEDAPRLTGTVERIRGQANNIRAQLRESRRTPSLADIVALNNAALGR